MLSLHYSRSALKYDAFPSPLFQSFTARHVPWMLLGITSLFAVYVTRAVRGTMSLNFRRRMHRRRMEDRKNVVKVVYESGLTKTPLRSSNFSTKLHNAPLRTAVTFETSGLMMWLIKVDGWFIVRLLVLAWLLTLKLLMDMLLRRFAVTFRST